MTPEQLMQLAIDAARRGMAAGQTPFGCAIALNNKVVAACHNTVWLTTDITAHAEINALREACRRRQQVLLEGAVVATTCEPCPMCMSALHWARVSHVYFGASIADAAAAGFNELPISAATILAQGNSAVKLEGACLAQHCRELFTTWIASGNSRRY
jgi:tRNA(Arg) A34 adenosine deaminase TadA